MPRILPSELTGVLGAPGLASYNGFLETWEETAELRWPNSVVVYDRMRRTDSQIAGILRAIRLPILKTPWKFHGDDVDPRVMRACEVEFGITTNPNEGRRARTGGIQLTDVLRHALLATVYGHMPFEQQWDVAPPLPGQDADRLPEYMAHLVKLDPRMPRSLTGIDVSPDGTLDGIRQWIPVPRPGGDPSKSSFGYMHKIVPIPSNRLVYFCYDREGSDWTGDSILRASYKDWLLKDIMVRANAQGIERQNMGIPVVSYPEDGAGNETKALQIATNVRSGAMAGAAFGPGWDLKLIGVTGSLRDPLASIQYHDESAGRAALAMFLNLGHDGGLGQGSLGDTFVEFFTMALNAAIHWLGETLTEGNPEHGLIGVVRRFVTLNFGQDEAYPRLMGDELTSDSLPAAEGLAQLGRAGLLTHDPDFETELRRKFGLTAPVAKDAKPPAPAPFPFPTPPGGPPRPDEPEPTPAPAPVEDRPPAKLAGTLDDLQRRLAEARAKLVDV